MTQQTYIRSVFSAQVDYVLTPDPHPNLTPEPPGLPAPPKTRLKLCVKPGRGGFLNGRFCHRLALTVPLRRASETEN